MIIGGSKSKVIENIKTNILNNELNKKVEVDDPNISSEEIKKYLDKFYKNKTKSTYKIKNKEANLIVSQMAKKMYKQIEICGEENLKGLDLSKGAIITANHFNPLDSLCERKVVGKLLKKKMYTVIQDTNLAMPGNLGFLMNYMDVIPISKSPEYLIKTFNLELKNILDKGNIVLIYPEEEMWFNYRKPRPLKRGAYQFAYEFNVPIISCFVEMIDTNIDDNDEFFEVLYKIHILKPILPDKNKTIKTNSIEMSNIDYTQKKEKYESVYKKKLDYEFELSDIAGLKKEI